MPSATPGMEQVHGIDVSWMTHGSPKDKPIKTRARRSNTASSEPAPIVDDASTPNGSQESFPAFDAKVQLPLDAQVPTAAQEPAPVPPKPILQRPGSSRGNSTDRNGTSQSPSRKSSWFSHLSRKLSQSEVSAARQPQNDATKPTTTSSGDSEPPIPKVAPVKNAVLQHAARPQGDGPYTPCPPKQSQPGFLHVFRRLSSSGPGQLGESQPKATNHGLVERKTLNVDRKRERCPIVQLHQNKLRRVAFRVDVEIAPMPKYADPDAAVKPLSSGGEKSQKRMMEKGEGAALKNPKVVEAEKEEDGKVNGEALPKEPSKEGSGNADVITGTSPPRDSIDDKPADTKKKEKKKKSEEERKARKEKKRQLAEANGQIPIELHLLDSDSSGLDTPPSGARTPPTPKTKSSATTNPVRIYRRCCQLRESPILKKVTEQLMASGNATSSGIVEKLDLTGYWMQLADLTTLGDFLAVVPIKEVILENCGLTDEGLRVILAGLLAAKKDGNTRRRSPEELEGLVEQGGFVQRLVIKNNKIGPEGWKYICLFVYLCRTVKQLDLSEIIFPRPLSAETAQNGKASSLSMDSLFARVVANRLAGDTLELVNLGDSGITAAQLGIVIDGVIKSGVRRLGLAHLDLDVQGLQHVQRYMLSGKCQALDLGGNDLRDHCDMLAKPMDEKNPLWALSLADCNLKPASLCKLLPALAKLRDFRFIDLSHNHDLFNSEPNALGVLRKYLPQIQTLKRLHLSDCGLHADQVIALAEVIPEMPAIAHINVLENPELTKLAEATTESGQEEASALYASLLAAARVSKSLVALDIDVPAEGSGEIVKALAKQVVAYCLRNMERMPLTATLLPLGSPSTDEKDSVIYPDVLQHLVGHDVMEPDEPGEGDDIAPDAEYIVGGTGIAKALAACLKNKGDDTRRQSGDFSRSRVGSQISLNAPALEPGKAKDVSKHLLFGARKIRARLRPALEKAKVSADTSMEAKHTYFRLVFLLDTLDGIIKRFEDEYPETRETPAPSAGSRLGTSPTIGELERLSTQLSQTSTDPDADAAALEAENALAGSDLEDDPDLHIGHLKRSNSRLQASEEAQAFRTGHKFRSGWITTEQYNLVTGAETIMNDPTTSKVLRDILEDVGDPELLRKFDEKGGLRLMQEDKDELLTKMKASDPEHWDRFVESQEKAKANIHVENKSVGKEEAKSAAAKQAAADEVAVADD